MDVEFVRAFELAFVAIPQAIEKILRYEPPADHIGRYVARDGELYGTTIPEGSVVRQTGRPMIRSTAEESPAANPQ